MESSQLLGSGPRTALNPSSHHLLGDGFEALSETTVTWPLNLPRIYFTLPYHFAHLCVAPPFWQQGRYPVRALRTSGWLELLAFTCPRRGLTSPSGVASASRLSSNSNCVSPAPSTFSEVQRRWVKLNRPCHVKTAPHRRQLELGQRLEVLDVESGHHFSKHVQTVIIQLILPVLCGSDQLSVIRASRQRRPCQTVVSPRNVS
jgi:hypothetical protein